MTDGERLPFDDGAFDIACSMGVLHHIENPRPMISEIRRVLKPGGRIILMLYYLGSWKYHVVLVSSVSLTQAIAARVSLRH